MTQKSGVEYAKTESMPDKEELGVGAGISSASRKIGEIASDLPKKIDENQLLTIFDVSSCQFFIYATRFK